MFRPCFLLITCLFTSFGIVKNSTAQTTTDGRIQYPASLQKSFFGVNVGYINYPFSSANLEPGFSAAKISVPHPAVRLVLYGRRITKHLSAQVTYMRPVSWVKYKNINGTQGEHSVWMNVGGLTMQGHIPVSKKISLEAEAGLGVVTRKGFSVNNTVVMRNVSYASVLAGASVHYHINSKWDLQLSTVWSPDNKSVKQPATNFISVGFNYRLMPLTSGRIAAVQKAGFRFPKQMALAGLSTNVVGYGVNNAVSQGPVPIFWGGEAEVRNGIQFSYQRNIFRSKKVFAMDWAAAVGWWKSRQNNDAFFTLSLVPVLKFMALRKKTADLFFEYAVAGPTFISKTLIDNKLTGRKFTFYDFMGMGALLGKQHRLAFLLRIAHFSNGNIFPYNDGVKVPLTFCLGYSF